MVKVYAPASLGNVGVGFDLLGMALASIDGNLFGDCVSIKSARVFSLEYAGCFSNQLPKQLEKNIVFQCWKKFCEILGKTYPVNIRLEKNLPIASGLGSSACSIVATLMAMNHYCGYPLNDNKLLMLMGEMEGSIVGAVHFDNVSPCFLGGMQLMVQEFGIISQKIPIFDDWLWILAYPGIAVSTAIARSKLPQQYNRTICINYGRYLSGFIHACHTKQESLAIKCMKDVIAESYRSSLLPMQLSDVRRILVKAGALSCGISGSGPTIFVLCNAKKIAEIVYDWLSNYYLQNDTGFVQICRLDNFGARILAND